MLTNSISNMTQNLFPDVMVDLETTGLSKDHNAVIQIAAVKFNLAERTVDGAFFDKCLMIPPGRYWDEGTRSWWGKRPEVIKGIYSRMEEPKSVLEALRDWAGPNKTMWGKPTHFDHTFLDSYFVSHGMQIPFHFRNANDMNSFIRARYFPASPPAWEVNLPFEGVAHNAIFDVLHQIKVLFHVMDHTEGKISL